MTKNVGAWDRALRVVGAAGATVGAVVAPWPAWVRVLLLGGTALYLAWTALAGSCLGYTLMGRSTSPRSKSS
jgi:hypothetical protein